MNSYDFINRFSKITINSICKKLNINQGNLYNRKTKKENADKVKQEIETQFLTLYLLDKTDEGENNETNTL